MLQQTCIILQEKVCKKMDRTYTTTTATVFTAPWTLSKITEVSQYQKGKINWDLLERDIQ